MKLEDKNELIINAIKNIEKLFGKGAVINFSETGDKNINITSSGSILLDDALGIGGYPRGRIIEIFGPESAGKTTLALMALAAVQKVGEKVAFIDAAHALDALYCEKIGVNLNDFLLSQPDSGEQALDILEILIKSHAFSMIVIDSVAALVPQAELNGDFNDQLIGAQARLMSKALRKLITLVAKSNCTVIFINQLREKVGVVYGNPEVTPGGRALRFYSSQRLEVRKGEQLVVQQQIIGHKIKIKVVKNKIAPPYKVVQLDFYFSYGISKINEFIDLAVTKAIITKVGPWYSFDNIKLGQGKDKTREFLEKNSDILDKIKTALL